MRSARRVFEERGFTASRIADFTDECGVAVGTFYTYFSSKAEVLAEVLNEVEDEVYGVLAVRTTAGDPPQLRIRLTNELAIASYRRNARFWAALEEASLSDESVRRLMIERRQKYRLRTSNAIRSWQADGKVRPDIDPDFVAMALGSMTERCAYLWFVVGEPVDIDTAVRWLTDIWYAALGLPPE
ncbi:MAG TPA: TetR/AcrR family transcriptional regulator [Acidimicrobiales bacterium]